MWITLTFYGKKIKMSKTFLVIFQSRILASFMIYIYVGLISAVSGAFYYRRSEPTFLDKKYIPNSSVLQF